MGEKHTNGPWKLGADEGFSWGKAVDIEAGEMPSTHVVATVYCEEGDEANARLIAAAPELLAALRANLASLAEILRDHPEWAQDCDRRAIADARAVIAAATGGDDD